MRVQLDTNVVLDVLLNRETWVKDSAAVWQASDDGRIIGHITATTLTDTFYVSRRLADLDVARKAVRTCLDAFEVCAVDRDALERAEAMSGNDFEDNLQIACAAIADLDVIVTRNKDDFETASTAVLSPSELIAQLSQPSSGSASEEDR
jgi:predicted nucleic acid-binding protein